MDRERPQSRPRCIEDCYAFVAGRNVTKHEVTAVAEATSFAASTLEIPDQALPG